MATFSFFGQSVELPAQLVVPRASSRDASAWHQGRWVTVKLLETLEALRVHTDGKAYPGRDASNEAGAWVLIGDVIQTSSEIADSRSLPVSNPQSMVALTHVSEAYLKRDTVINVGLTGAKFGGMGGGFQAEYVSGPTITFRPLSEKRWHSRSGNA